MSKWLILESCDHLNVPYLESFHYDAENRLTFLLSRKYGGNIKVHFNDHWVFRMIDEGKAFETLGEQEFNGKAWVFMAENSELIDWFNKESCEIYKDQGFKHFIILAQHHIFEILGQDSPQITIVE
ncbi:hypothetical protein [Acinetobacter pollinis]|uniref:hypothetical protein n=1 Tax=Acinetobacter pollinis TaxID=2605270 RepID=UPI0018C2070F|nr:hypothetical protein [Acinetobacter pollinis]MBF7694228.1 hypothetical protein [Acinetobacter pollinis]MBF7701791.1 hypothetical protein [Acinetobacter pollinis]